MAYRNKTYVCFDADEDIRYYRLMLAWKEKDPEKFNFHNAHDLYPMRKSKLEDNDEPYIKRKLTERFNNSKCFILLVGEKTKNLYKYVRWEIEVAKKLDIPIIIVNLNKKNRRDRNLCPPIVREHLAIHIPYGKEPIAYAMKNWPSQHQTHRLKKEDGAYYYSTYD
ncbi:MULTISPECIES: TIR domain-containing protein [Bacillaceae]|uniref:TIR domain-containing protein n=1 Tax=Evansella alkalicola TaxID=745819 RepID=A0ABS6JX37_9BACI|nr:MULTISPECIES: TIR domain-containing protein [Bacillaceae]MBU9723148.1 TIR domain-containing protein [Bacillus alkalicola]